MHDIFEIPFLIFVFCHALFALILLIPTASTETHIWNIKPCMSICKILGLSTLWCLNFNVASERAIHVSDPMAQTCFTLPNIVDPCVWSNHATCKGAPWEYRTLLWILSLALQTMYNIFGLPNGATCKGVHCEY